MCHSKKPIMSGSTWRRPKICTGRRMILRVLCMVLLQGFHWKAQAGLLEFSLGNVPGHGQASSINAKTGCSEKCWDHWVALCTVDLLCCVSVDATMVFLFQQCSSLKIVETICRGVNWVG